MTLPLRFALGLLAATSLFLGGLGAHEARADEGALDGCSTRTDSAEVRALVQAGHDLGTADDDRVRAAVAEVRAKAPADPFLLLWGGSLLQRIDPPTAQAMFQDALRVATADPKAKVDPKAKADPKAKDALPYGDLYQAAALLRLGKKDEGRALLSAVRKQPDALVTYTCRFIPAALALADTGALPEARELLAALQKASPGARSIADALLDVTLRIGEKKSIEETFARITSTFPTDIEFTVRRANHVKVTQGPEAALAILQPLLVGGESSPSLLGEYLGLVSASPSEAQLAEYKKLSDARPQNLPLRMMVGVIHHYLHHYEESSRYLEGCGPLIDSEPRVAMYLAMNYLHTPGKEAQSEAMIERAARAGRPDPDIYYCRAVIGVRKDPAAAARDLERYLALTRNRADVREQKQSRVRQTLDLLNGCAKSPDPKACVQTQVVEQAKALAFAEHFGGGAPGGGLAPSPTGDAPQARRPADLEDPPQSFDGAGILTLVLVFGLLGGFAVSLILPAWRSRP